VQLNIQISQDNAATDLRRGGGLHNTFFCNSLQNATVKELLKLVYILSKLSQKDGISVLFWLTVYDTYAS